MLQLVVVTAVFQVVTKTDFHNVYETLKTAYIQQHVYTI